VELVQKDRSAQRFGIRRRVEIGGLSISTRLIGKSLNFMLNGFRIYVIIPSREEIKKWESSDEEIVSQCSGKRYKKADGKEGYLTTAYYLNVIDIFVEAAERDQHLFLDKGKLRTRREFDSFLHDSGSASTHLQKIGAELAEVGEGALDRFLEVLRWKGGQGQASLNGQSSILVGFENRYRYAAINPDSGFNHLQNMIHVFMSSPVSLKIWKEMELSLQSGFRPPVWVSYLTDAEHRSRAYDHLGTLLSCAVALESFLRSRIERTIEKIPNGNDRIAYSIRRIQMSEILDNPNDFSEIALLKISERSQKSMRSIFQLRNEVMHGRRHEISMRDAKVALETTRELVKKR